MGLNIIQYSIRSDIGYYNIMDVNEFEESGFTIIRSCCIIYVGIGVMMISFLFFVVVVEQSGDVSV